MVASFHYRGRDSHVWICCLVKKWWLLPWKSSLPIEHNHNLHVYKSGKFYSWHVSSQKWMTLKNVIFSTIAKYTKVSHSVFILWQILLWCKIFCRHCASHIRWLINLKLGFDMGSVHFFKYFRNWPKKLWLPKTLSHNFLRCNDSRLSFSAQSWSLARAKQYIDNIQINFPSDWHVLSHEYTCARSEKFREISLPTRLNAIFEFKIQHF